MSNQKQARTRAYYQNLLKHQGQPIGFFEMTGAQWAATLGLAIAIASLGATYIAFSPVDTAGWILIGMSIGTLARDIGIRIRAVATWPHLDAVFDWERVRELAAEPNPAGQPDAQ